MNDSSWKRRSRYIAAKKIMVEFASIFLDSGKTNMALKDNEGEMFLECVQGKKKCKEFQGEQCALLS